MNEDKLLNVPLCKRVAIVLYLVTSTIFIGLALMIPILIILVASAFDKIRRKPKVKQLITTW